MQKDDFRGVLPAITTKMTDDQAVDFAAVRADIDFQIEAGVDAVICCGSLGEASTLVAEEKIAILDTALDEARGRAPVLLTIAEDSTRAGCRLAEEAAKHGAAGLMVLPAMRYVSDPRETIAHFRAVAAATDLPIIVYNNPVAYAVDVTPAMLKEMADEPKFVAIKESTGDIRRVTDTINTVGDRYQILTGVDDIALESMMLGCVGWIAGLVSAFPRETVMLHKLAAAGRYREALGLYRWFMPLLHLDVSVKFVQNIKLAESIVRGTSPVVRAPRLPLVGEERDRVVAIVEAAIANRPALPDLAA
jgi:1-pyrroline-4-hydroxy-2-carboxylate deaminase